MPVDAMCMCICGVNRVILNTSFVYLTRIRVHGMHIYLTFVSWYDMLGLPCTLV
jgi:hypothetical protein